MIDEDGVTQEALTEEEIELEFPHVDNVDFKDKRFMKKAKDKSDPDYEAIK